MSSKDTKGVGNIITNQGEGMAHNFDFFQGDMIEKSMGRGYEQEIRPTTTLTNEGPYEFFIPPSNEYIFLPLTRLYIKMKVTRNDGTNLPAATNFSVANLLPHTLFKQIDVEIGGVNTSSQDQMYPYKAYLETLLSYPDMDGGHLPSCSGYIMDDPRRFDAQENSAYELRRVGLVASATMDFCIPLHCDILQSVKVIPGNTSMKFTLSRNTDAFSFIAPDDADLKINILALKLYIRKITPTPTIKQMHLATFEKTDAYLPFSRSVIKKHLINAGATNISLGGIFKGILPRQILVALIKSTRIDGRIEENPFKFDHYTANYINLRIDGQNCPPVPFQPNFTNGLITRELRALYDNIGVLTSTNGPGITRGMYNNGYTLFAWDLTPDGCNGWHIHEQENGKTVDLDLQFEAAIPDAVNVVIYATYETGIRINKEGVATANFIH